MRDKATALALLYISALGWASCTVVWMLANHDAYAWTAMIFAAAALIFAYVTATTEEHK